MNTKLSISREIGTALAVLALYLLTILTPLHEARASQLVFEKLGYTTLQTGWVLCNSLDPAAPDSDISVTKCPAAGIGKPAAVAPAAGAMVLELRPVILAAPRPVGHAAIVPAAIAPPSGPRGPPALV